MKSFYKYFFLVALVILVAAHSNAEEDLLTLHVTIREAASQESLAAPQEITVLPSQKYSQQSFSLHVGEEIFITVTDPNNQFHNGNIANGSWNSGNAIHCYMTVNDYNGYENWYHDRWPMEATLLSNQSPLYFHYKAIRVGSVDLLVYQGPSPLDGL